MSTTLPRKPKRNATMQDIADIVGVSRAAVSQALAGRGNISPQKRQEISETAKRIGFEPDPHARRLSTGRYENLIGLFTLNLDQGTDTLKVSQIQHLLRERNFDVSLQVSGFFSHPEEERTHAVLQHLCRLKPRAIICNTRDLDKSLLQILKLYQSSGGELICYDLPVTLECGQVIFDREGNTSVALQYLIDAGHRRIGVHTGEKKNVIGPRTVAFKQTMNANKVRMHPEWMFYTNYNYEEAGLDIATQFLALSPAKRPSALYIVNDRKAAAFVHEVIRKGVKVPGDLSVISDDDLPFAASCFVPLTAVSQPVQQIAQSVVELLEERLKNPGSAARTKIIKGHLTERDSVK